jgi:Na+-translocating ferredoxin:NAD+ oxidoreductase RNF subunit RnfB
MHAGEYSVRITTDSEVYLQEILSFIERKIENLSEQSTIRIVEMKSGEACPDCGEIGCLAYAEYPD